MLDDQGFTARLQQGLLEGEKIIKKLEMAHEAEKARLREERREKKRAAAAAAIERQQNETAAREREAAAKEKEAAAMAEAEKEENEVAAAAVEHHGGVGEVDGDVGMESPGEEGVNTAAVVGGESQASAGTLIIKVPGKKQRSKRGKSARSGELREVPCVKCQELGKDCFVETEIVCRNCKQLKARCDPGDGPAVTEKRRGKKRARSPSVQELEFVEGSSKKSARRPRKIFDILSSGEEEEKRREAEDQEDPRDEAVVIFERLARKFEGIAKDYKALAAAFQKYDV